MTDSTSLRPFSREDYLGYEGAEELPSGAKPLIGSRTLYGDGPAPRTFTVLVCGDEGSGVADRVAVSVHILSASGAEEEWWYAYRATEEGARDLGTFLLRAYPSQYLDGSRDYARDLTLLGFGRTV